MKKLFKGIWKVIWFPFAILLTVLTFIFQTIIPLIPLSHWLMQRNMSGEARRIAKEINKLYAESKSNHPDAPEKEVIMKMVFNDERLAQIPVSSRKRIEICCESIQGFCYMMALDVGRLKGLINVRSLQFTHYMDKALEAQGFPPQSKEQKERILEAMELRIPRWDEITGD